jgi:hypothetical protein
MKTLKDIYEWQYTDEREELRQTAIEWVKELESESNESWINRKLLECGGCESEGFEASCESAINIKHFFNLAEADLNV